ncbi:DUF6600 domain-containing protein [Ideonella sp. YS5]|uniref:DUF6600 domain-containing protein n=1 Tax=Ideonella sp. YS5 TaxID=3453714 RepID=UPI003EEC5B61
MNNNAFSRSRRWLATVAGLVLALFALQAQADPPGRAARLAYLSGNVSFAPAGEDDWDQAAINRPMTTGDRLWVENGSRAELQLGGTTVRAGDATAVSLLNLDDDIVQLQLTEGRLQVRVRRVEQGQTVEVDTPHLAFLLREPGAYRIDVDPDGRATTIAMREGQGEVSGEGVAYWVQPGQVQRFIGDAQPDETFSNAAPPDDFDAWAGTREQRVVQSVSARYVSPDVIGYEDLDDDGSWSVDVSYGNVWYPRSVAADWAPYRHGHWTWVDPWGWTWVDDARWGFAVSHYGRWAHIRGRWGWIPGPVRERAYYAPALVAFVGGPNFSLSISTGGVGAGVAWFPLGPREVYRPAYQVSPRYFERVNISNTVVNKTVINNVYINKVTNITYVNRRVPGAVVAVPRNAFVESQSVSKVVVKVPKTVIEGREVMAVAPVAPTERSIHGGLAKASGKPPAQAFTRTVVARTPPPPPKPAFAVVKARLDAQPGKPLNDDQRKEVRAARGAATTTAAGAEPAAGSTQAPQVKVVTADKAPAPKPLARAASGPRTGQAANESRPGATARDNDGAASEPRRRASEPGQGRRTQEEREPGAAAAAGEGAQGASAPRGRGTKPGRRGASDAAGETPAAASAPGTRPPRADRRPAPAEGAASAAEPRAPKAPGAARERPEGASAPATRPPRAERRPPATEGGASAEETRPNRPPAAERRAQRDTGTPQESAPPRDSTAQESRPPRPAAAERPRREPAPAATPGATPTAPPATAEERQAARAARKAEREQRAEQAGERASDGKRQRNE